LKKGGHEKKIIALSTFILHYITHQNMVLLMLDCMYCTGNFQRISIKNFVKIKLSVQRWNLIRIRGWQILSEVFRSKEIQHFWIASRMYDFFYKDYILYVKKVTKEYKFTFL
jgi:hypothetical protein